MTQSRKVIWISFGPIGDTLMMLALFDEILATDPTVTFTVLSARNDAIIRDLCAAYPAITVIGLSKHNLLASLAVVIPLLAQPAIVLVPSAEGVYSIPIKLLIAIFSLRPGNRTAGFFNTSSGFSPFRNTLEFDYVGRLYIDNLRALAVLVGLPARSGPPHVRLRMVPPENAPASGSYILIHMFAANTKRSLPDARWTTLLGQIADRRPHYTLISTAAKADAGRARKILEGTPVRLMEGLPMDQMAWLVEHSRLYIGVDTGITHMAGVLQKKSVVIGNRSNPTWLPTYNPNARILANTEHCTCDGKKGGSCTVVEDGIAYYRCLYEISDEDILAVVDAALAA